MKLITSLSIAGLLVTGCSSKSSVKKPAPDTSLGTQASANDGISPIGSTGTSSIDNAATTAVTAPTPVQDTAATTGDTATKGTATGTTTAPVVIPIPDAFVGRGFESVTTNYMQACLGGTITMDGLGSSARTSFERVTSLKALATLIAQKSGDSDILPYTVFDQSSSFLNVTTNTNLESSYTFAAAYVIGTKHIDDTVFRVDTTNRTILRRTCGDSYVSSAREGGVYLANVTLHFKDASSKEVFDSSYEFATLFSDITTTASSLTADQKASITLSIKTLQIGGGSATNPALQAGQEVTCSLDNLDACGQVISAIGDYGLNGFHDAVVASPEVLSFQINPYPIQ